MVIDYFLITLLALLSISVGLLSISVGVDIYLKIKRARQEDLHTRRVRQLHRNMESDYQRVSEKLKSNWGIVDE